MSVHTSRSGVSHHIDARGKRAENKGVKRALAEQFECLQQIRRDIDEIKSRKLKEDKKQVLSKVKQIERALEKNEEKNKFEKFKADLLLVG